MGQEEVIKILRESIKPMCSKEIRKKLGTSLTTVNASLRKLKKQKLIGTLVKSKIDGRLENSYFILEDTEKLINQNTLHKHG